MSNQEGVWVLEWHERGNKQQKMNDGESNEGSEMVKGMMSNTYQYSKGKSYHP